VTGARLGPADVPPWRSVFDSETTDLHGSTCELHAVLVMTSSIRLIRASRIRNPYRDVDSTASSSSPSATACGKCRLEVGQRGSGNRMAAAP